MEIDYIKLTRERVIANTQKIPTHALLLLLISFLAFLSVITIDAIYNPIDYKMLMREGDNAPFWKKLISKLIAEKRPIFTGLYLVRTALIICCSVCAVMATLQFQGLSVNQILSNNVFTSRNNLTTADPFNQSTFARIAIWVILLSSLAFLTLFIVDPVGFYNLGNEDQPIEILSAFFYFISCGLFVYTLVLASKKISQYKYLYLAIISLFAFGFFILGMEEISWFQRVFAIETPEAFKSNLQNEMNFHNFYTNPLENAFYFASFVFLILIPFINENILFLKDNEVFSFFIPSRFIIFVSAIFVAYNYDMWNIIFTQLAFFITFFILAYYAWMYIKMGRNSLTILSIFAVFVITQILFIAFGDNFVRLFDVTEYKELFIPIGFFFYSLEVLQRIKHVSKNTQKVTLETYLR